jgi:deazaflavin-dependent oxidoreductase (nitroreductase family)
MWYNPLISLILRSPLHWLLSNHFLLLSYTGRRSGKTYSLPVNYVQDENQLWITSLRNRTWWKNLVGEQKINIWLRGAKIPAHAVAILDEIDVFLGLARYFELRPDHAKYFDVHLDETGAANQDDLKLAARKRLVVRVSLPEMD